MLHSFSLLVRLAPNRPICLLFFLDPHPQLKMVLIKCCDISNEVRPMEVAEPWVDCLLEEYFMQVCCWHVALLSRTCTAALCKHGSLQY